MCPRWSALTVYTKKVDMSATSLAKVRANKFLNNKSTLLKLLPPSTYREQLLAAPEAGCFVTIADKTALLSKHQVVNLEDYGWYMGTERSMPIQFIKSL